MSAPILLNLYTFFEMRGMRSRTHSRVNTARVGATRLAFISNDIDPDDFRLYGWSQLRGPFAIEPAINWVEVSR